MRTLTAVTAALAVCALVPAQASAQASNDPAKVQAGTYVVEPMHTRVLFAVNHFGFTTYYGNFTGVSGSLQLDPVKLDASQVAVSIPVASVSTTNAVLDGELKSATWLNAAVDPNITFKSTKVVVTGPTTADITGELTLHGVTKPVVLAAKFNGSGPNPMTHKVTVGFDATTHLSRSDFGVKTFVPYVGDQVDVTISAAFEKTN